MLSLPSPLLRLLFRFCPTIRGGVYAGGGQLLFLFRPWRRLQGKKGKKSKRSRRTLANTSFLLFLFFFALCLRHALYQPSVLFSLFSLFPGSQSFQNVKRKKKSALLEKKNKVRRRLAHFVRPAQPGNNGLDQRVISAGDF